LGEISSLGIQEKELSILQRSFWKKNGIKLPYLEGKKFEFARFKTIASRMSLEFTVKIVKLNICSE
jgi:hypothetical protein